MYAQSNCANALRKVLILIFPIPAPGISSTFRIKCLWIQDLLMCIKYKWSHLLCGTITLRLSLFVRLDFYTAIHDDLTLPQNP